MSLSFVVENYPAFLGTEAPPLLASLVSTLVHHPPRSPSLQSAMFTCVRQFTKVSHPDRIATASEEILIAYYEKPAIDEDERGVLAALLLQLINGSAEKDLGDSTWCRFLEVSYVGSFDPCVKVAELWGKVFNEALVGSTYGTKLAALSATFKAVISVAKALLRELSWARRG